MIDYLPKASEQLLTLIYSIGIGFALGLFYEILRLIFYLLSGSDKKFVLLRDIIFLLFCLTVTFFYFLVRCNGKVTFYAVTGEGIGGLVSFKAVDPFVSFLIGKKLRKLRKKLSAIPRAADKTINFARKIHKNGKNINKRKKIYKNDLHNRHDIVYNQSVTECPVQEEFRNRGDENG